MLIYNIGILTSSFTCQLISIVITTVVIHNSFTLSLQAQNLPCQEILPTLDFFTYRTAFMTTGLDRPITLIVLFLVSHFNFLFVPCGGLSWLPVSFLLHVKYTLSYRIAQISWLLQIQYDSAIVSLYTDVLHCLTHLSRT